MAGSEPYDGGPVAAFVVLTGMFAGLDEASKRWGALPWRCRGGDAAATVSDPRRRRLFRK